MYGEKFCENCGKSLGTFTRPNKRTCSDKCRQQLSRRADQIASAHRVVMTNLSVLRRLLRRHAETAQAINPLLVHLEQEVRDLRRMRPDEDMKALADMQYDHSRNKV